MMGERPAADGPGVAILLSTFNGERYLAEQLASFIVQTHANWQLYWRDDGSSDGDGSADGCFCRWQRGWQVRQPPPGAAVCAQQAAFWPCSTSLSAVRRGFSHSPIRTMCGYRKSSPAAWPRLPMCLKAGRDYISRARGLVDAALAPVGEVLAPRRAPGFPAALTQNLAPGCCMMLNRAAAELIDTDAGAGGNVARLVGLYRRGGRTEEP